MAACIEQPVLGDRARRHQPGDGAANHRLSATPPRFGGVLRLLADGDAVPEPDELLQIVVGGMDRHAAHRDVGAEMLAALGQRDAERPRRGDGVVEEQLVEIAHAIKEQAIRIGRPDLDILLHHRRDAAGRVGAFRRRRFRGILVAHCADASRAERLLAICAGLAPRLLPWRRERMRFRAIGWPRLCLPYDTDASSLSGCHPGLPRQRQHRDP